MTTHLSNHLKTILEDATSVTDDLGDTSQHATGRTAYKPSEQSLKIRARKSEIAQLARELGRQPTPDEIDLIFGDLDVPDPSAPYEVSGSYGRASTPDDDSMTRRPDRGPTARRFRESPASG